MIDMSPRYTYWKGPVVICSTWYGVLYMPVFRFRFVVVADIIRATQERYKLNIQCNIPYITLMHYIYIYIVQYMCQVRCTCIVLHTGLYDTILFLKIGKLVLIKLSCNTYL